MKARSWIRSVVDRGGGAASHGLAPRRSPLTRPGRRDGAARTSTRGASDLRVNTTIPGTHGAWIDLFGAEVPGHRLRQRENLAPWTSTRRPGGRTPSEKSSARWPVWILPASAPLPPSRWLRAATGRTDPPPTTSGRTEDEEGRGSVVYPAFSQGSEKVLETSTAQMSDSTAADDSPDSPMPLRTARSGRPS